MDLVGYHWSGKHHKVVKGINVQSLVWSNGDSIIPIDFRVYNKKEDDKAKKNHILFAIRSFLRPERYSFKTGISWMNARFSIVRDAVRTYLQNPYYNEILATA